MNSINNGQPEASTKEPTLEDLKSWAIKSPRERLGVSSHATEAEIKKAYRTLSMKYHPDKVHSFNNENLAKNYEEVFKLIDDAYSELTDSKIKKGYYTRPSYSDSNASGSQYKYQEPKPAQDPYEWMVNEEKVTKHPEIFVDLKKKWSNNYKMIKYEYEKQVKAYDWMVEEEKSNKHPEIFVDLKKKWSNNYEMIKYEYEKQVKAYDWMVEEEKSNKHPEIFVDLKKKWSNNYEMIKYEYEAYIKGIKS